MENLILIDGQSLTLDEIYRVASDKSVKVAVQETAREKILKAREVVEKAVKNNKIIYGLTTGFGEFKNVVIDAQQAELLQKNLIMSHAIGVGEPFDEEIVRAAVLIRANSLARGYSGIRLETIEAILDIINYNLFPFVPSQGSVGASGDLAPLSHLVLARMGLGEFLIDSQRKPATEVLPQVGLKPLILTAKEGLALNNGTAFMTALAVLNLKKSEELIKLGDIVAGMSLEAAMGTLAAFNLKIQQVRPHQGQINTADNISRLCQKSQIMESHKNCDRVQDSYSLRCIPQVHGAIKDTFNYVKNIIEIEINSVTDNPLIFPEQDEVISGGNFHGEPIALAMDFLGIALAELANISDRRLFKLLAGQNGEDLPPFLLPKEKGGLNSGYMITQYTTAALVAENKVLSHPASVDSIPTCANQEDHVSFGMTAALKTQKIINNTEHVLNIELMVAAQALDFKKPLKPGRGSEIARDEVRRAIPFLATDRMLYLDLEKIEKIFCQVIKKVEQAIGPLNL